MALGLVNRQWLLRQRPDGMVQASDFQYCESEVPSPGEGEMLLRSLYFGYDASQRLWLSERGSYMKPIQIGEPMLSVGIGQVVESKLEGFAEGDLVYTLMSWQDYVVVGAGELMPAIKLTNLNYPLSWNLGLFGAGGLTAYFGVVDCLNVQAGDIVVVSAAAGSTGSVAGNCARAAGAKTLVGIARGEANCRWLVEKGGYDYAIDAKIENISERLAAICPRGVDAFFDLVGGETLEAVLDHMVVKGRVFIGGAVANNYAGLSTGGPNNFMSIVSKSLTFKGLFLPHYQDQFPRAVAQLSAWLEQGLLAVAEDVVQGFDKAPELLPTVFTGKVPGKLVLHIADPQ